MPPYWPLVLLLIFLLAGGTVWLRMLTAPAAMSGAFIASLLWLGTGWTGIGLLAIFFGLGAGATRWARGVRKRSGAAEGHPDTLVPALHNHRHTQKADRRASQVWANGGLAALMALAAIFMPEKAEFFLLLAAAALTSAATDTLSSELGTLYGKRFFNILSFKPDTRGADGAVSLEGTVFGLIGSMIMGGFFGAMTGNLTGAGMLVIAGTAGNLADSLIGARWQRRGWLNNDQVNALNTLTALLSAILLSFVL
ncbi:MAG TPA: DUF92 domain-containing protein [Flavihumibacter sp.]